MSFKDMKELLSASITQMFATYPRLYIVAIDKDELWDTYLGSFPEGTNPLRKERTEHDCQHCKQFIRGFGNVVAINEDNTLRTIWDFGGGTLTGSEYQPVMSALNDYVLSKTTSDVFSTVLKEIGVDYNMAQAGGEVIKWTHFHTKIPASYRNKTGKSDASIMGTARDNKAVLFRSLDTISASATDTIIELIAQNSIYKGEEWAAVLSKFRAIMTAFNKTPVKQRDNFCWRISGETGPVISKIRNHSIGTLLVDVSEGMDLREAVAKYEAIVAPTNYKRPKAVFSKRMLQDAKDTVVELGLEKSLHRRFASIDDVTVDNVLFADRDSTKRMTGGDVFEELEDDVVTSPKKFDRATEIPIDKFIADVLPTATAVELLVEPRHRRNVVSLIAPAHPDSKPLFKWGNSFSWAYAGNITDAMKERVKAAGGDVSGVLRFSIQWNEAGGNQNDLDAHCVQPQGHKLIHYPYASIVFPSSGVLDVDIVAPGNKVAVENITFGDLSKMPEGVYKFLVHVYDNRGGRSGFRAQVEFDNQIFDFDVNKVLRQGERVPVASVKYTKASGFEMVDAKGGTATALDIAGLAANTLHPVTMCCLSPNYWDGKEIGNKHFMFMMQGGKNEECPNGFFNEFLPRELEEHKRVFAALGDKMKVEPTDQQLTGLGFSSTKRDSVILKVHGHTTRVLKVMV